MSEPPHRTRLLLVDDHALFRESIARLLGREPDLDVVGHCGSIKDGLHMLRERPVDLVLLDYDLGPGKGNEFLRLAREAGVDAKMLIVTAGVEPARAAELIRTGISGIFLKRDSAASLAQSIRDIMAGKVSFERQIFEQAVANVESSRLEPQTGTLTDRERQVLTSVFEGLANKEIAARLGVSESSVKATIQQLFAKTGVRTRSQLVRIALERYQDELSGS
jgi:DNA-binding NarL/FixJ family response regulator